jgi:D-glycero-D-manno-heptose 1,7-bisphosphate phosphatase
MPHRAVFLDRDGTIIQERHYLSDPDLVTLLPGVLPGLQSLLHAGFHLFIVTNQSGVGRGFFTLNDVHRVHDRLTSLLSPHGVTFSRIYVAPESPDQPGYGRKPSPQFLFDARQEFHVDLATSYLVGDKLIDLECGWNAGLKASLLVRTGYGAQLEQSAPHLAQRAIIVDNLPAAANWIINDSHPRSPISSLQCPKQ